MQKIINRIVAFTVMFCLVFEQSGFAQVAPNMNIPAYLSGLVGADKFRPMHMRWLSYDRLNNSFDLAVEKGDDVSIKEADIKRSTAKIMEYFQIGLRLPDSMFWVNLRPDAPDQIIDPYLERTDIGKIMLEADLQLKKDVARFTSPDTKEGRQYWNLLYAKAEQIFGQQDVSIPTITRPWIVPNEIIVKEYKDGAYVYKATMKVMLEQDYLRDAPGFTFADPRLKELNEYSSEIVRQLIIPQLTREVNSSKRYSGLRQVFYSLVLAQWFKQRSASRAQGSVLAQSIDSRNLSGVVSKTAWSKDVIFNQYVQSFRNGEYNKQETLNGPTGVTVRQYFSGGIFLPLTQGAQSLLNILPEAQASQEPAILGAMSDSHAYTLAVNGSDVRIRVLPQARDIRMTPAVQPVLADGGVSVSAPRAVKRALLKELISLLSKYDKDVDSARKLYPDIKKGKDENSASFRARVESNNRKRALYRVTARDALEQSMRAAITRTLNNSREAADFQSYILERNLPLALIAILATMGIYIFGAHGVLAIHNLIVGGEALSNPTTAAVFLLLFVSVSAGIISITKAMTNNRIWDFIFMSHNESWWRYKYADEIKSGRDSGSSKKDGGSQAPAWVYKELFKQLNGIVKVYKQKADGIDAGLPKVQRTSDETILDFRAKKASVEEMRRVRRLAVRQAYENEMKYTILKALESPAEVDVFEDFLFSQTYNSYRACLIYILVAAFDAFGMIFAAGGNLNGYLADPVYSYVAAGAVLIGLAYMAIRQFQTVSETIAVSCFIERSSYEHWKYKGSDNPQRDGGSEVPVWVYRNLLAQLTALNKAHQATVEKIEKSNAKIIRYPEDTTRDIRERHGDKMRDNLEALEVEENKYNDRVVDTILDSLYSPGEVQEFIAYLRELSTPAHVFAAFAMAGLTFTVAFTAISLSEGNRAGISFMPWYGYPAAVAIVIGLAYAGRKALESAWKNDSIREVITSLNYKDWDYDRRTDQQRDGGTVVDLDKVERSLLGELLELSRPEAAEVKLRLIQRSDWLKKYRDMVLKAKDNPYDYREMWEALFNMHQKDIILDPIRHARVIRALESIFAKRFALEDRLLNSSLLDIGESIDWWELGIKLAAGAYLKRHDIRYSIFTPRDSYGLEAHYNALVRSRATQSAIGSSVISPNALTCRIFLDEWKSNYRAKDGKRDVFVDFNAGITYTRSRFDGGTRERHVEHLTGIMLGSALSMFSVTQWQGLSLYTSIYSSAIMAILAGAIYVDAFMPRSDAKNAQDGGDRRKILADRITGFISEFDKLAKKDDASFNWNDAYTALIEKVKQTVEAEYAGSQQVQMFYDYLEDFGNAAIMYAMFSGVSSVLAASIAVILFCSLPGSIPVAIAAGAGSVVTAVVTIFMSRKAVTYMQINGLLHSAKPRGWSAEYSVDDLNSRDGGSNMPAGDKFRAGDQGQVKSEEDARMYSSSSSGDTTTSNASSRRNSDINTYADDPFDGGSVQDIMNLKNNIRTMRISEYTQAKARLRRYLLDVKQELSQSHIDLQAYATIGDFLNALDRDRTKALEGRNDFQVISKLSGEVLPVLDEDDRYTGLQMDNGLVHIFGLRHATDNAVVFGPNGELILQRRVHNKADAKALSIFGGHNHVDETGEMTIRREVREELGLQGFESDLTGKLFPIGGVSQFKKDAEPGEDEFYNNNEFRSLFVYYLSPAEFEFVRSRRNYLNQMRGTMTQTEFARWIEQQQALGTGYGEVWNYVFTTFGALRNITRDGKRALTVEEYYADMMESMKVDFSADMLKPIITGEVDNREGAAELNIVPLDEISELMEVVETGDEAVVKARMEGIKAAPKVSRLKRLSQYIASKIDRGHEISEVLWPGSQKNQDPESRRDGGTEPTTLGGVDFRAIPTVIAPALPISASGVAAPVAVLTASELERQWSVIQQKVRNGEMPYTDLQAYISACCADRSACAHLEKASLWMSEVLKMEEDACVATSGEMKELIALL